MVLEKKMQVTPSTTFNFLPDIIAGVKHRLRMERRTYMTAKIRTGNSTVQHPIR